MMTRIHGVIHFECDGCADALDTETRDFEEARTKMRAEGWRARQYGRDWSHYCSSCTPPGGRNT